MKKLNKKGFALAETLIVSVFVVSLFTLIYVNFFPIMGEYEKREGYDDVDSIYKAYNIKKMLEANSIKENVKTFLNGREKTFSKVFDCNDCYEDSNGTHKEYKDLSLSMNKIETQCRALVGTNDNDLKYCKYLITEEKIVEIYISKTYELDAVKLNDEKKRTSYDDTTSSDVLDYIDNQPFYKKKSSNNKCKQRIVVKYINQFNIESSIGYRSTYSYATIGVDLGVDLS